MSPYALASGAKRVSPEDFQSTKCEVLPLAGVLRLVVGVEDDVAGLLEDRQRDVVGDRIGHRRTFLRDMAGVTARGRCLVCHPAVTRTQSALRRGAVTYSTTAAATAALSDSGRPGHGDRHDEVGRRRGPRWLAPCASEPMIQQVRSSTRPSSAAANRSVAPSPAVTATAGRPAGRRGDLLDRQLPGAPEGGTATRPSSGRPCRCGRRPTPA